MNASSSGDLGDLVAGVCGVLHSVAGPHTVYLRDDGVTKGIVKREHIIRPLLEAQTYIESVKVWNGERIDWTSEGFRNKFHRPTQTLLSAHARHAVSVGVIQRQPTGAAPWLTSHKDHSASDRIIINRTNRYRNPSFPWGTVVKKYGARLLFIGGQDEHSMFETDFGQVEYRPTKDLLEAAGLIAGGLLFIGNQSAAMTIAEGLKVPRIQETCLHIPDCIYPGLTGAQYVGTGECLLPGFDGDTDLKTLPITTPLSEVNTSIVPPGGWQLEGFSTTMHFMGMVELVAAIKKLSKDEASRLLLEANIARCPDFFPPPGGTAAILKYHTALTNAQ